MKRTFIALAAASLLLATAACTPHTTGATEVGVRFNKITRATEVAPPGATYFFMPIVNDWTKFDVSTQSLVMSATGRQRERGKKDDLRFKTRDGNDIETDVTVRWRIDPSKAVQIWETGRAVDAIARGPAGPAAGALLCARRAQSPRFRGVLQPRSPLPRRQRRHAPPRRASRPYGIIVEQVILGNFAFKPDYQKLINQRKEAEKQAEKLEARDPGHAGSEQANLQQKIAELTEQLTRARRRARTGQARRGCVSRAPRAGSAGGDRGKERGRRRHPQRARGAQRQRRRRLRQPAADRRAAEERDPPDPEAAQRKRDHRRQQAAAAARRRSGRSSNSRRKKESRNN